MRFFISATSTWLILTSTVCQLNIIIVLLLIEKYTNHFEQSEVHRGACKCGSTSHARSNHTDCPRRSLKRRPEVESIQSPAQRQRLSTPNITDCAYLSSPLTIINRTIPSLNLNSNYIVSIKLLHIYERTIIIFDYLIKEVDSVDEEVVDEENKSKKCRCGSTKHLRTNHSSCRLNKKFNNLTQNEKKTIYRNKIQKQKVEDFFEIARKEVFSPEDVFGTYIQTSRDQPHYGRHIIPPRSTICPDCDALMWFEEKTGGTKNKPAFQLCCNKGLNFVAY